MVERTIVDRYTRALFAAADKRGIVDQVRSDLRGLDAVMTETPQLGRVLRAPTIAAADKRRLIRSAFTGQLGDLTLKFLEMAIEKRREEILPFVSAEFERLAYDQLNILPVQVTSALPLTEEERAALSRSLNRRTGKTIELHERVNAALMGGATMRLGDTEIDGSVRGQLRRLRDRLLAAPLT
jgi:F-type H+-transporting ATPase subunit delta